MPTVMASRVSSWMAMLDVDVLLALPVAAVASLMADADIGAAVVIVVV
jgi:hypothetical protein